MSFEQYTKLNNIQDIPGRGFINIRAVGDILMIAGAGKALADYGLDYPFGPVEGWVKEADIAFANLEMPICSDPNRKPSAPDVCPDFISPPQITEVLKRTGFHVINLANNHLMDWGIAGLNETLSRLHALGLQTIGAGENLQHARRPAILERNNLKIGFLGYSERGFWIATDTRPGAAPIDRQMILQDIKDLRPYVDLLVVSLHTGIYSDFPSPEDRQIAQDAIDNGADLILGHGPHVVQGIESYHSRSIIYSMGNFMIDLSSGNVENKVMLQEHLDSIIINASLFPGTPPKVDFFPVVISDKFQVVPADSIADFRIRTRVEKISRDLDKMTGLTLWEHAGTRNVEHQISVMAFQMKHVSLGYVLNRMRKIRWRHIRLILGYMVSKLRGLLSRQTAVE
jgi:poly-gamma-glutamate synthesis protein (capsule biosynthesis protein)